LLGEGVAKPELRAFWLPVPVAGVLVDVDATVAAVGVDGAAEVVVVDWAGEAPGAVASTAKLVPVVTVTWAPSVVGP
jgi:hypothetical protein